MCVTAKKFLFAILICIALVNVAFAESWRVSGGLNGTKNMTWNIERSPGGAIRGNGEVTGRNGQKYAVKIFGSSKTLRVTESPSDDLCHYRIKSLSTKSAAGDVFCESGEYQWTAKIENPVFRRGV